MRIAYLDCFSGASGDMLLGSLIDAGVDFKLLIDHLQSLGLSGVSVESWSVQKGGLRATKVRVQNDHDHEERHLHDILDLLSGSSLPPAVVKQAGTVFRRLAEVEGRIHQMPPEQIHFHEIGAADSIVDIVGTILGFHLLEVDKIFFSALPYGQGTIRCQHGILPNPSPAALELMQGVPLYQVAAEEEMVTPTGAVLLTSLGSYVDTPPRMPAKAIGYGAGSRILPWPNVLRLWLGEIEEASPSSAQPDWEDISILETTIDDMNPEWFPYLRDKLESAGAVDIWWKSVTMKKGRTGQELTVLSRESDVSRLIQIILAESTTLGVRVRQERRCCLERREVTVATPLGSIPAKQVWLPSPDGRYLRVKPEYDACRKLAEQLGIPLEKVYSAFWKAVDINPYDLDNNT